MKKVSMNRRFYVAYGELMSFAQMQALCLTAKYIGTGYMQHWRLSFHGKNEMGIENIKHCHSSTVPFALWSVTLSDEMQLDTKYNYRFTYTKISLDVYCNGRIYTGFTYILNATLPCATLSHDMKLIMQEGYSDNNIPLSCWDTRFF